MHRLPTSGTFDDIARRLDALADDDREYKDALPQLKALCARAARRHRACAVTEIPGFHKHLTEIKFAAHKPQWKRNLEEPELQVLVWQSIALCEAHRLHMDWMTVGGYDVELVQENTDFVSLIATSPPERWRDRARDYAEVCRLLHEREIDAGCGEHGSQRISDTQPDGLSTPVKLAALLIENPYWPKKDIAKAAGTSYGHMYRLAKSNEALAEALSNHPGPRGREGKVRPIGEKDAVGRVEAINQ